MTSGRMHSLQGGGDSSMRVVKPPVGETVADAPVCVPHSGQTRMLAHRGAGEWLREQAGSELGGVEVGWSVSTPVAGPGC